MYNVCIVEGVYQQFDTNIFRFAFIQWETMTIANVFYCDFDTFSQGFYVCPSETQWGSWGDVFLD